MAAMAGWVIWRWYGLEAWKVVCARTTARKVGGGGVRRGVGGERLRPAVPWEEVGGGVRQREDRPPPYAAFERPPPAYVEMLRLGGDRV